MALSIFSRINPPSESAGSRLVNQEGIGEWSAFRFPTVLGEVEGGFRLGVVTRVLSRWVISPPPPLVASRCDWSSGASLMIRAQSSRPSVCWTRIILCISRRWTSAFAPTRPAGRRWYVPQSEVLHLAGQSSGVTDRQRQNERLPDYWFQARRYYNKKHLGPVRTLLANICWSLGFSSFRVRQWLFRKPDTDPEFMLRDFLRYNFFPNGSLSIKWCNDRESP